MDCARPDTAGLCNTTWTDSGLSAAVQFLLHGTIFTGPYHQQLATATEKWPGQKDVKKRQGNGAKVKKREEKWRLQLKGQQKRRHGRGAPKTRSRKTANMFIESICTNTISIYIWLQTQCRHIAPFLQRGLMRNVCAQRDSPSWENKPSNDWSIRSPTAVIMRYAKHFGGNTKELQCCEWRRGWRRPRKTAAVWRHGIYDSKRTFFAKGPDEKSVCSARFTELRKQTIQRWKHSKSHCSDYAICQALWWKHKRAPMLWVQSNHRWVAGWRWSAQKTKWCDFHPEGGVPKGLALGPPVLSVSRLQLLPRPHQKILIGYETPSCWILRQFLT